jgi:hypothetical protein
MREARTRRRFAPALTAGSHDNVASETMFRRRLPQRKKQNTKA